MALDAPEPGWTWVTVPRADPLEATVIGDVHTWYTHWVTTPGHKRPQAVRCVRNERDGCHLCAANHERRCRYVMPVLVDGQPRLLELGRCQYPALVVAADPGPWLGSRLVLWRERPHPNAVIRLRVAGHEHVSAETVVDVADYVRRLGTDTLRLLDTSERAERAPR